MSAQYSISNSVILVTKPICVVNEKDNGVDDWRGSQEASWLHANKVEDEEEEGKQKVWGDARAVNCVRM